MAFLMAWGALVERRRSFNADIAIAIAIDIAWQIKISRSYRGLHIARCLSTLATITLTTEGDGLHASNIPARYSLPHDLFIDQDCKHGW